MSNELKKLLIYEESVELILNQKVQLYREEDGLALKRGVGQIKEKLKFETLPAEDIIILLLEGEEHEFVQVISLGGVHVPRNYLYIPVKSLPNDW